MKKNHICFFIILLFLSLLLFFPVLSFSLDSEEIRQKIARFKEDRRGPYAGIRWYCKDGTVLPARQPCEGEDGHQHAFPKDWVRKLANEKGIYFGQILTGTDFADFWDRHRQNSRLKQYILEKFLRNADEGWIFRQGRYYRGAVQAEDEEEWGENFLQWLLADGNRIESQFFLLYEAVKEIPHGASENLWKRIRFDSRAIAESYREFENLRIKLHGRPRASDTDAVRQFHRQHGENMPASAEKILRRLITDMEKAFAPPDILSLRNYIKYLSAQSPARMQTEEFIRIYGKNPEENFPDQCKKISGILLEIRRRMLLRQSGRGRLIYADLAADLEKIFFRHMNAWQAAAPRELLEKNYALCRAAAGCGLLELWEWEMLSPLLAVPQAESISLGVLTEKSDYARRVSEWGSGMIRAAYEPVIRLYSEFEPLAKGFADDRIRASLLLPLGDAAGKLNALVRRIKGNTNRVMGKERADIRGLNPGFALGELIIIKDSPENISFAPDKIYILPRIPSDIRPVAGIAAVSEGNLVSHVQLLARNFGIPNAVISPEVLRELLPYSGQRVFYAVSPGGTVLMKSESAMNDAERSLTDKKTRKDERLRIPTDKIDLKQTELPGLGEVRARDSGRICGPKAANLGELKHLFPDNVVDGIVIPFAVFRQHMEQPMPGTVGTFWSFLRRVFDRAEAERLQGRDEKEIEAEVLRNLEIFRNSVKNLPFLPEFRGHLSAAFQKEFGRKPGQLPVFIRSDTNMEDLEEFTGAGLNKTVFNVRKSGDIWQGIRDVWASPFRERGYLWRQKYMKNPENVYPSLLIMPTVTVEKSGVMITADVSGKDPRGITVAFSTGPGGAVEGQAAESWLLRSDGKDCFLSPSRETEYYILPEKGGSHKGYKYFHRQILHPEERQQLREFAEKVKKVMADVPAMAGQMPYDVELGFKEGKIWLFQIRPFAENRQAKTSLYLHSLDPEESEGDMNRNVLLDSYKFSEK
ncbi:MAG: PEP/pyruvate-binding domain-containing protein [Desulfococcaceae bacterium]|nr:PEP/pyruvate-binding domain-containing protein [Desulfococcaceae bacterium]